MTVSAVPDSAERWCGISIVSVHDLPSRPRIIVRCAVSSGDAEFLTFIWASDPMRCPCRKKSETVTYADCCGPYHVGTRTAPTAEALMRSRYTAFAMQNSEYLLATWHPTTRPAELTCDPAQEWMLLRVIATSHDGNRATVEFVARSRIDGRLHDLREVSNFVREDGRWFYVAGAVGA